MVATNHILTTKLYAPPPRRNLVQRSHLTVRLDAGLHNGHRLFLLSAPAGYGRTTLLSRWLGHIQRPSAWLSLDTSDDDLRSFFAYFVAALQQVDATVGEAARSVLAIGGESPNTLATTLLNDIAAITTPFVLVLDDYHLVTSSAIHEVLSLLLEYAPPHFHLVMTTRVDPPLPLAKFRARAQMTEIRAADLRFSLSETNTFFRQTMQIALNSDAVQVLAQRTEGWIASLQLAALSLHGQDEEQIAAFVAAFRGSNHYIIDYLTDEVLRRQDQDVLALLRQTACLDRFCASVCDAITGRNDSKQLLTQLAHANLFLIPLDAQHQWYRYHHLFADALQAELNSDADQQARIQQRAACWFEAQGAVREAIRYALAAKAWDMAARLIKQATDEALFHFELGLLDSWLRALPEAVLFGDPELLLTQALNAFTTSDTQVCVALLSKLHGVSQDQFTAKSWGRLVSLRAWLTMLRETPDTIQALQHALVLTAEDDLLCRQRTLIGLGLVHRLTGNTPAASESYREAVRLGANANVQYVRTPFAGVDADRTRPAARGTSTVRRSANQYN